MMTPQDEYEAKTRRMSNDVIILLQLSNGNVAVYNNTRTLTAIIDISDKDLYKGQLVRAYECIRDHFWKKPISTIYADDDKQKEPTPIPPVSHIDIKKFV